MTGLRRFALGIPLVILACALLGGVYGGRVKATESLDSEVEESLRLLAKVYSAVEENYADPVNADKAIYNGAIPGMLRNLDPHSSSSIPGRTCFGGMSSAADITGWGCRWRGGAARQWCWCRSPARPLSRRGCAAAT